MHSLFFFIIALSLLVVIHEFGHFWVARRCGVKVLKFSVGFGQPIWKKVARDGTEYILAAIPLGGYVKMLDEREGEVPSELMEQAFNNKSLAARTAIVAAGPLANLLFAVFAYWLIFVIGIPGIRPIIGEVLPDSIASNAQFTDGDEITRINNTDTPTWATVSKELFKLAQTGTVADVTIKKGTIEDHRQLKIPKITMEPNKVSPILNDLGIVPIQIKYKPIIGTVVSGSPADKAGIQKGDQLISFEGKSVDNWADWVKIIQQHPNKQITIEILRKDQKKTLSVTPTTAEDNTGKIGVGLDASQTKVPTYLQADLKYNPISAIVPAIKETWDFASESIKGIIGMLTGQISSKNIGGPIAIAQIAGASAQQGILSFIYFLAMISVSLGILNLLPIPVLDGGHLMMNFFEWINGKPLSEKVQLQGQKVGILLLLSLMLLAFFNDLSRLFGS